MNHGNEDVSLTAEPNCFSQPHRALWLYGLRPTFGIGRLARNRAERPLLGLISFHSTGHRHKHLHLHPFCVFTKANRNIRTYLALEQAGKAEFCILEIIFSGSPSGFRLDLHADLLLFHSKTNTSPQSSSSSRNEKEGLACHHSR